MMHKDFMNDGVPGSSNSAIITLSPSLMYPGGGSSKCDILARYVCTLVLMYDMLILKIQPMVTIPIIPALVRQSIVAASSARCTPTGSVNASSLSAPGRRMRSTRGPSTLFRESSRNGQWLMASSKSTIRKRRHG